MADAGTLRASGPSKRVDLVAGARPDVDVRNQLSNLQGLLTLSMLMTTRSSEAEILDIATTAVPSLAHCRLVGVSFEGGDWWSPAGAHEAWGPIADRVGDLGRRGDVTISASEPWILALELRSVDGSFGHIAVAADAPPSDHEQFVLRALAQHTATALANARLHARERSQATELRTTNDALAASVAALEESTAIHVRLTEVAATGGGQQAIAEAVHEVTSLPVAIEDRHGNLRAWAGAGRPDPYAKDAPDARAAMLDRAIDAGRPLRIGDRIVAVAHPATGVLGVLALVDPDGRAGRPELQALEYGATVLAIDLARLHAVAESELRLGRDLVDDLLAGHGTEEVLRHAQALGFDLARERRVVVVHVSADRPDDHVFHAVRRAARDEDVGTLLSVRANAVIVLAAADCDWSGFLRALDAELQSRSCVVGVGGCCAGPAEFPRSFREARVVVNMQQATEGKRVARFDELGVYRLLADAFGSGRLEHFVAEYLGALAEYDTRRGTDLVRTLGAFFDHTGNYEATAAALHLHRSTLKYRLRRVHEISGLDLSIGETQFNLQLAIRARYTLDALRNADL